MKICSLFRLLLKIRNSSMSFWRLFIFRITSQLRPTSSSSSLKSKVCWQWILHKTLTTLRIKQELIPRKYPKQMAASKVLHAASAKILWNQRSLRNMSRNHRSIGVQMKCARGQLNLKSNFLESLLPPIFSKKLNMLKIVTSWL